PTAASSPTATAARRSGSEPTVDTPTNSTAGWATAPRSATASSTLVPMSVSIQSLTGPDASSSAASAARPQERARRNRSGHVPSRRPVKPSCHTVDVVLDDAVAEKVAGPDEAGDPLALHPALRGLEEVA